MRPYIALDIEFTGRNKFKSEVMEAAVILDDGFQSVEKLQQYNFIVKYDSYAYSEPAALLLNRRLVEAQLKPDVEKVSPKELFDRLFKFTKWAASTVCYEWDVTNIGKDLAAERVTIAGKNIGSVIMPVLTNFFLRNGIDAERIEAWLEYISDRHLDVASIYYPQFDYVPAMEQVNKLTGRDPVENFDALKDAMDAVFAIRHAKGIPYVGVNNR